jgi:hypothetical protein
MNLLRTALTITLLTTVCSFAAAQEPARLPIEPPPAHWNEAHTAGPNPVTFAPPCTDGPDHFFSAQLFLGTESGIRVQFAFERACHRTWLGEVFLGGAGTSYGSSGVIGLGGRVQYALASGAWGDHLLVSPGLDLMFLGEDGDHGHHPREAVTYLAPTVDISWLHDFDRSFGWELGVHAGIGIGLGGRDEDNEPAGGKLTPIISVYTGVRF